LAPQDPRAVRVHGSGRADLQEAIQAEPGSDLRWRWYHRRARGV